MDLLEILDISLLTGSNI